MRNQKSKLRLAQLELDRKFNFKTDFNFEFFDLSTPSAVKTHLKILPRAQGKMGQKYKKNAKWPKITFRGPIWVPNVPFWGCSNKKIEN